MQPATVGNAALHAGGLPALIMGGMCRGRKRWILSVPVKGTLLMDAGAVRAVIERSKSLFSAGIVGVSGDFNAQDAVQLCDADGTELGRGLCNYSAAEVDRIKVTPVGPVNPA